MIDFGDFLASAVGDFAAEGTRKMRVMTGSICAVIGGVLGFVYGGAETTLDLVGIVVFGVLCGGGIGALFTSGVLFLVFIAVCIGLWFAASSIWGT
jgi:hypothetical protein